MGFLGVGIDLDKRRQVRFDLNALADLEERSGRGLGALLLSSQAYAKARWLLWAGLRAEDSALTLEDVGRLIQTYLEAGHRLGDLALILDDALLKSGVWGPPPPEVSTGG